MYYIILNLSSTRRSGNGGSGDGGSCLSYLQEQTGPGWIPVTDPAQVWTGSQNKARQAMDTMMSSICNVMDGDQSHMPQEALLEPVRDMGHSEILKGHFRGTQPFEKGLGFPHRVPDVRTWDDFRLKFQVCAFFPQSVLCLSKPYVQNTLKEILFISVNSSLGLQDEMIRF